MTIDQSTMQHGVRDPAPTQGPGSAAGEFGDAATRAAFVAGAPISSDGTAVAETQPAADATPAQSSEPRQSVVAGSRPAAEDGPGPLNNQGQRVPVSFDPQNADEMYRYAQMLARSSLLPKGFYAKDDYAKQCARVGDVHFVLMKGKSLGLHPMTAIGNINIIDGKAEIGSLLMLSLVRRSGLMIPGGWRLIHSDDQRAVFATRRVHEDWTEFEYTIEEAAQMGLLDKGRDEKARENNQWRKQPRTMLRRRCTSSLLREIYSDVVLGLYDHGELSEMRERERALGIDPDSVISMNGLQSAQLAEAGPSGPIETLASARIVTERDPLKARLANRRQAQAAAAPDNDLDSIPPERVCSKCYSLLDPRDTDPCGSCRQLAAT
jgi:hypothetical protein